MPLHITRDSLVRQRPGALSAAVGSEVVLMSLEQGKYYGLDDIGSVIWRRIDAPVSVTTLCASLAEEYEADVATIEHDVLELLAHLERAELVELADA